MKSRVIWLLLPALGLAAVLAFVLLGRPLNALIENAPPVEELVFERVTLDPGVIVLDVRADGSTPIRVAQVQVDGAYRMFSMEPGTEIGRLGRARIALPYPWIEGEAHHVNVVTSTGATFDHTIEVATPKATDRAFLPLLLVGLLLGIAPVAAGMLAFPAIRDAPPAVTNFVLALTIGLLVYLFVDTLSEGIEVAEGVIDRLRAETLVWVSMVATALVLLGIGRLGGRAPEGAALAFFVALGIGLHNFGEGLVVGAAISTGAAALAVFLVVGFVIHNVSEGFAIAAPMASARPPLWTFVALAVLAGLPALPGVALGAMTISAYWTALCFGIGAGAIAQVIIEVTGFLVRRSDGRSPVTPANVAGGVLGLAIMYSTALLV